MKTARDTLRQIEDILRSAEVCDGISENGLMPAEVILGHIFEYVSHWAACRVWRAKGMPEPPDDPDFNWRSPPAKVVERWQREHEAACAAHVRDIAAL